MSGGGLHRIVWLAGEPALREALDAHLAGRDERSGAAPNEHAAIRTSHRRTLHEATLPPRAGQPTPLHVVLKTHHLATGRHRLREAIKRRLGRSPARREWQALVALHAAGLPVPRPLAYGRLASGDELIVQAFVPGRPLATAWNEADPAARDGLVEALIRTLDALEGAGWQHGDLHLGNLRVEAGTRRVVLLDLERARRGSSEPERLRDLARLELSLVRADWPVALRRRIRAGRVDTARFDAAHRRFLADHRRGRARRAYARGLAPIERDGLRGQRDAQVSEASLLALVARAERSPARRERRGGLAFVVEDELAGRPVVVKGERALPGLRGWLQRGRHSRAARAFRRGRLDRLLLARAATPLAYLETTRPHGPTHDARPDPRAHASPTASWLVLERVGDLDLDRHRPVNAAAALALATALADWLAELHAAGLGHADLKASNLRIALDHDVARFWLVDLEDLTGPTRLRDAERLKALVQLNASLADEDLPIAAREAALARYLERLPFEDPRLDFAGARREIARRARARRHRFRGEGCACVADLDDGGEAISRR